jgi:hypothetical protein
MMAARQQAKAQAQAAEYNAEIEQQQAAQAMSAAAYEANLVNQKSNRMLATARADYGAAGLAVEGSPLLTMSESAAQAEMDQAAIMYKGKMGAYAHQAQSNLDTWQAGVYKRAGNWAMASALVKGIGSAAGGMMGGGMGSSGGGLMSMMSNQG